jgi:hypothetical protein
MRQSFLTYIVDVLCGKLENKHDCLCKRYTLKYVSTEADAKHAPLGLETHRLLMHMQYICPSQRLISHMFKSETHEHEWLAHCK